MSTIIKHKEFPKFKSWTMDLCGRPLTIEVGKVAELANASAMVKYGDTTVLVAVTVAPRPRDGVAKAVRPPLTDIRSVFPPQARKGRAARAPKTVPRIRLLLFPRKVCL